MIALTIIGQQALVFLAVLVWCSFAEWTLHRFVMHRRFSLVPYPYQLHALQHHVADETYHAQTPEVLEHVSFVPKDYLFLLALHGGFFLAFEWVTGIVVMIGGLAAVFAYLQAFNSLHWRWHVPSDTWFQRTKLFRWMKERHRIHHGNPTKNANLILPVADLIFGTYVAKEVRHEDA
jgi:hypothetical protein